MQSTPKKWESPWIAATMGLEFAGAIAAGALIGWLFDNWLNSAPRGLTIGTILGLLGGAVNFVRMALLVSKKGAGKGAIERRARTTAEIPPPGREKPSAPRKGRYDPRGPVDVLDSDDDTLDPPVKMPPDHDKW